MKKISLLLSSLFVGSLALAQTTTLYYVWENPWTDNELDNLESWSTSSEEKIKPTVLWDNNTAIEVDFANGTFFSRLNIPTAIPFDVYSFNSSVGIDFWVRNSISTVGDFNVSTAVHDGGYDPISGNDGKQKQLRFALSKNDFLTVGGNMTLSTDGIFVTRFERTLWASASDKITLRVKGRLSLNHDGMAGYHVFDMAGKDSNQSSPMEVVLGGLSTSGNGAYMTTAPSTKIEDSYKYSTSFVFQNNDKSEFAGGSFTGVFATESDVSSEVDFTMNGSGTQSIKIYKAANGAACGLGDFASKKDMTITTLNVLNGVMNFDTEIEIQTSISVSGGRLNLTSSANLCDIEVSGGYLNLAASADVSAVRLIAGMLELNSSGTINMLNIEGGDIVFGDTASVQSFNVFADNVGVYFDAEDLASNQLTILEFEESEISAEADTVFTALDSNGNELGGKFEVVDNKLVYFTAAVPEPATMAGILGALALALVAYRRRK